MTEETRLAELLCTRLCHDLTGPIGAVNNGAEFLSEDGFDMDNEAMGLILSSAGEATRRLQFFRQAYGRINASGEASMGEKRDLAAMYFEGGRITLDWPDNHAQGCSVSVSYRRARVLLNLIMIVSSVLLKGGTLAVRLRENDAMQLEMEVRATGEAVKVDADIMKLLEGKEIEDPLGPKTAHAYFTQLLANECGLSLSTASEEQGLYIKATASAA